MFENELIPPDELSSEQTPHTGTTPDDSIEQDGDGDPVQLENTDTIDTYREKVIDEFILESRKTIDAFEEDTLRRYRLIEDRLSYAKNPEEKKKISGDFNAIPNVGLVELTIVELWSQFKQDYPTLKDFIELESFDRKGIKGITNQDNFPDKTTRKRIRMKLYELLEYLHHSMAKIDTSRNATGDKI